MKRQQWPWLLVALSVFLLVAVGGEFWLNRDSEERFLKYRTIAQPGIALSTVSGKLGRHMYVYTDPEYMVIRGSVKDLAYCRNKTLYWFDVGAGVEDWVLEIYTDRSGKIVRVDRMYL